MMTGWSEKYADIDSGVHLLAGELQCCVYEENFCHRDHRGHRELLVFSTLYSLCSLWLILFVIIF